MSSGLVTSCCFYISLITSHLFPHLFTSDSVMRCSCRYVHRIGHHVCEVRHGLRRVFFCPREKGKSSKKLEFSNFFSFSRTSLGPALLFKIHWKVLASGLERTVGSSARRCKQCRYKPKMLMDFIKMNVQKLNIPKLIHACERR